ncbi:extensin-like domain-containing protein [Acuticoccus sediminis]|uniref:extensin-like domain-containing protein n=1 Tax=Acuticoccus sediminis TaxID=2184697 RepID=UPI001CFE8092|nr:extensin family protein [Acuticoccus sediminis]
MSASAIEAAHALALTTNPARPGGSAALGFAPADVAPPLPILKSTVVPAAAHRAPPEARVPEKAPEETANLAEEIDDQSNPGIPRPKPEKRQVAARTAPSASRPRTQARVNTSIRAGQLDPGEGKACEALLSKRVSFKVEPTFQENSCGAPRPLAVSLVEGVSLSTTATLRCPVATALADWTRTVVNPAAKKHFRQEISSYLIGPSYACRRRRNGTATTRLSEHAFANAIDIAGFKLKDGTVVMVEPDHRGAEKAFQAEVREGACGVFKTVLGPRTVAYHDDHLHLDSAPRGNGSVYCR